MIVIRKTTRCCQCRWYWPDNKMARAWKGSPGGKFFKEEMEWNKGAKAYWSAWLPTSSTSIFASPPCLPSSSFLTSDTLQTHSPASTGWVFTHPWRPSPLVFSDMPKLLRGSKEQPKERHPDRKKPTEHSFLEWAKYQDIIWVSGHRVSPDCAGNERVIWNRDQMILKLYLCWAEAKENNRLRAEEFAVRAWNVHIVPAPSDTDQWSQARMLEQHWDAKDLAGIRIGYSSPPTHPAIYIWSHNWTRKVREITLFSAPCTVYCRRDSVSLESKYERNWLRVWEREEWWELPKMPSRT